MINFWNSVLGFSFVIIGIILMIDTVRTKKKIGKDTYGGIIKMRAGAIGFILIGLFLFLRELSKLW
jgi:ABC-type Mn2+/Zn2+ transport system permease subunit